MLNYSNIQLNDLAVHRVGNKQRDEKNFISESLYHLDEEILDALMHYFLKPMKKANDVYRFQHRVDVNMNEVYAYCKGIFDNPSTLLENSKHILNHLYDQSEHPNIKSGEVYIAHFSDLLIEDELVEAVGIFKSEQKNTFFKVSESGNALTLNKMDGINIDKLDKGALVINTAGEDGFRVMSVDNNAYDTMYWTHHFLSVDFVEDANFHTKLYLDMINEFSAEVVGEQANKSEQVQFMANTVDYFATNKTFDFNEFANSVTDSEEMRQELSTYKEDFGLEEVNGFEISNTAFKTAKKKIKSTLKLDTNIQIKLDVNNPEACTQFIEKGYDEKRGMSFYKVYFNDEE